jgi:EAL domain-containing protein (putative c-di-GMP-specific phosphodiesterase class I)
VRVLLDDFGTGYSSLNYLQGLPIDGIKLDRTFIAQLEETISGRQIVAAVVALARALQMSVIAEGVETEGQLTCLRDLGCHFAQGYHFARPMPADRITAMLETPVSPIRA